MQSCGIFLICFHFLISSVSQQGHRERVLVNHSVKILGFTGAQQLRCNALLCPMDEEQCSLIIGLFAQQTQQEKTQVDLLKVTAVQFHQRWLISYYANGTKWYTTREGYEIDVSSYFAARYRWRLLRQDKVNFLSVPLKNAILVAECLQFMWTSYWLQV